LLPLRGGSALLRGFYPAAALAAGCGASLRRLP